MVTEGRAKGSPRFQARKFFQRCILWRPSKYTPPTNGNQKQNQCRLLVYREPFFLIGLNLGNACSFFLVWNAAEDAVVLCFDRGMIFAHAYALYNLDNIT